MVGVRHRLLRGPLFLVPTAPRFVAFDVLAGLMRGQISLAQQQQHRAWQGLPNLGHALLKTCGGSFCWAASHGAQAAA